jgi:hypothetical protein
MILADNATDVYFSSVEETEKAELTKNAVFDFAREVLAFIPANELAMKEMLDGDEYEENKELFLTKYVDATGSIIELMRLW